MFLVSVNNQQINKTMEKITRMINFANNLKNTGSVLVSKSSSIDFAVYCKMSDLNVKYELSENKIKFILK